jgi:hypothetical protein
MSSRNTVIDNLLSKMKSGCLITQEEAEKFLLETNPAAKAALARAEELAKIFQFNEVVSLFDSLIEEVRSMSIASRYSATKKIFSSTYGDEEQIPARDLNPILRGLTEKEYKRWQLEYDITELKKLVIGLSGKFKGTLLDIEATKIE